MPYSIDLHVEKPFLDQLGGLGWEVLDLDGKQYPGNSLREPVQKIS